MTLHIYSLASLYLVNSSMTRSVVVVSQVRVAPPSTRFVGLVEVEYTRLRVQSTRAACCAGGNGLFLRFFKRVKTRPVRGQEQSQ